MTLIRRHKPGAAGARRRGFSLAEMMIALVILGFGLLVVGAALPVGFTYTKQTVDRATGDAAVEYALDTIERQIRLVRDVYNQSNPTQLRQFADIFQPRIGAGFPNQGRVNLDHEPIIKVRPLLAATIGATPSFPAPPGNVFGTVNPLGGHNQVVARLRYFYTSVLNSGPVQEELDIAGWVLPPLSPLDTIYPPAANQVLYPNISQFGYFAARYNRRAVDQVPEQIERSMAQPIRWTAFYRRVSYAEGSDPSLYEVIVVATRVNSAEHRYPLFNATAPFADAPAAGSPKAGEGAFGYLPDLLDQLSYARQDTLTPVPYLVSFQGWDPVLQLNQHYVITADGDRVLMPDYPHPPTISFFAGPKTGQLITPGSVLIPARNDDEPDRLGGQRFAGFVPHTSDTLPFYHVREVQQMPNGDFEVVVDNNGFYPWERDSRPDRWPVWIIPPAFAEADGGLPRFDRESSIVSIGRRFMRFPEIP